MLTKLNNIKINKDYRDITIQEKLILSPNYGKNGFKNIILCSIVTFHHFNQRQNWLVKFSLIYSHF